MGVQSTHESINHMSLLEHLKVLRVAIPVKQKELDHNSQLPIFRRLKDIARSKEMNNASIFQKHSFCVPLLDLEHDPNNEKVTEVVKGIFLQGGKIIEFNETMSKEYSQFVIISEQSKL